MPAVTILLNSKKYTPSCGANLKKKIPLEK